VICNGGSPTCYQALSAGVPVIGIASNLDQFLNMLAIERLGAGVMLRADRATVLDIRAIAIQMLDNARNANNAARIAGILSHYDAPRRFAEFIGQTLGIQLQRKIQQPVR